MREERVGSPKWNGSRGMSVESESEFAERRRRPNEASLRSADPSAKRFFALDQHVYDDGALPKRMKEPLGLVASTALSCHDCISCHLSEAAAAGATEAGVAEALGIALIVGDSIAIPRLWHAYELLESIGSKE